MMGFQRRHGATQHQYGFRFIRLVNLYGLEAAGQRRIFLNVFFVFRRWSRRWCAVARAPWLA